MFFFFLFYPHLILIFFSNFIPKQIYKIKSMLQGLDCFGHKIKRGWHGIYHFTENFIPVSVYPYILPDCSESLEWSVLELIYCFDVNFVYLLLLFFSCYEWWWNTRDGQKDYYYLVTLHTMGLQHHESELPSRHITMSAAAPEHDQVGTHSF